MADVEQLKQKYAPVLEIMSKLAPYGAKIDAVDQDSDGKLHLKGEVPSKVAANRVGEGIKKGDPSYADLHHELATTGPDEQAVTIKSGDTLSAICLLFYGNANKYPEVAKANGIDANTIGVGKTLQLPVLS